MRLPRLKVRLLMLFVVVVGLVLGSIRFAHDLYWEQRTLLLSQLDKVKGIAGVQVSGYDDLTYEALGARFSLASRPDAEIVIQNSKEDLVGSPDHLFIQRIGPWELHEQSMGYSGARRIADGVPVESFGYKNWIDLGAKGPYADSLPVRVRDLNDIVAHYDELVLYFSTWPDEKNYGRLTLPSGTRIAYCRTTPPGQRPALPDPGFGQPRVGETP